MHTISFETHVTLRKTPTCFGTDMSSSGSYTNRGIKSPTQHCNTKVELLYFSFALTWHSSDSRWQNC